MRHVTVLIHMLEEVIRITGGVYVLNYRIDMVLKRRRSNHPGDPGA